MYYPYLEPPASPPPLASLYLPLCISLSLCLPPSLSLSLSLSSLPHLPLKGRDGGRCRKALRLPAVKQIYLWSIRKVKEDRLYGGIRASSHTHHYNIIVTRAPAAQWMDHIYHNIREIGRLGRILQGWQLC